MAELFEEGGELLDEAEGSIDEVGEDTEGEATEEGEEEEEEEFKQEKNEIKESVSGLKKAMGYLKSIDIPAVLKSFGSFIVEQAAIAAVFYGVTLLLKKLTSKPAGGQSVESQKAQKTKKIANLMNEEQAAFSKLMKWLTDHKDDTVDVGDGIEVPITDIFFKYTEAMQTGIKNIFQVAQSLSNKEKKTFNIPTEAQLSVVLSNSQTVIKELGEFLSFAKTKEETFPLLKSLPLQSADIANLNAELKAIDDMPYV